MKLNHNFKGIELVRDKLKDFKNVVLIQISLIFCCTILPFVIKSFWPLGAVQLTETIFIVVLGIYVWNLWDMLRNYTRSTLILFLLLILIMGVFVVSAVVYNPFNRLIEGEALRIISLCVITGLLVVELFVMNYTLRELSKRDLPIEEKLWGAACVYLLIGIDFAGIYELAYLFDHSSLLPEIPLGPIHYLKAIAFSFTVLSGIELSMAQPTELVSYIASLEAIWGNLFVVFVVGRLMYK